MNKFLVGEATGQILSVQVEHSIQNFGFVFFHFKMEVVKEGTLLKGIGIQSVSVGWKKKYAVLKSNGMLCLYNEEEVAAKGYKALVPSEVITLDIATEIEDIELFSITGKKYAFAIVNFISGKVTFCASSENEKQDWMDKCTALIKVLNAPPKQVSPLEYDIFLSHKQATGADLAMSLKLQLLQLKPTLKIFLDVDDLNNIHILEDLIKKSNNFLLILTEGALERPFVQLECRTALKERKNVIIVHDEKNCSFPNPENLPEDIKPILSYKAIPYYREKAFRDVSIAQILAQIKY